MFLVFIPDPGYTVIGEVIVIFSVPQNSLLNEPAVFSVVWGNVMPSEGAAQIT